MALVGADVEALRAMARTLTHAADRLDGTNRAITSALSHVQWAGSDAERFRADWHQLSRSQVSSAAGALREAAQALERNAIEQEHASAAAGGSATPPQFRGSAPGQPIGQPAPLVDPFVNVRDFLKQTPIWPITWGTMLGGVGALTGGVDVLPLVDALGLAGDTRLDDAEKVIEAGSSTTDLLGGLLKGRGGAVGYLAGVGVQQWGDVFALVAQGLHDNSFSPETMRTVTDYIGHDPSGAFDAAKDAVIAYVPKLFSNLVPW